MLFMLNSSSIPDHLHGYLSRFLSEVAVGVWVGSVSTRVADEIWLRFCEAVKNGSGIAIRENRKTAQGFVVDTIGPQTRPSIEVDGIILFTR